MHMPNLLKIILIILVVAISLVGCQPIQYASITEPFSIWKFDDVRLLDPSDSINPEQDLIAVYTKNDKYFFQIRMDFLNLDTSSSQDIYIPIDTIPGGLDQIKTRSNGIINVRIKWDYLIIIPASGKIEIVNNYYSIVKSLDLFMFRDPNQDEMVLSIRDNKQLEISSLTKFQVYITQPGKVLVIDQTEPISIDAPSPSRVKILFVFWNTFYSSTPAESLRSWAGAHSGPMSSRHGMKYLLEAADNYKYPIFLADLNTQKTMSALDFLGIIPLLQNLENNNVLYLFNIDNKSLSLIKNNIDFYNSNIVINGSIDYANRNYSDNCCMLLSEETIETSSTYEISLYCKMLLASQGLSSSTSPIIFGGDFQESSLSDPSILNEFFSYIYNHPWIQVLSIYDLQPNIKNILYSRRLQINDYTDTIKILQQNTPDENRTKLLSTDQEIYSALIDSPDNQISSLAFKVFYYLLNPDSPELISLGANYIGQVGHIIEAAKWVENPYTLTTCSIDLDYDEENECILSNNNIFLTIEPKGGYIPFIYSLDKNGAHQIVGPTWEFMLGLSDPSAWDLSHGVMSDPGQILGAFIDNNIDIDIKNDKLYIYLKDNNIVIENEEMAIRKLFSITDNSINVKTQLYGSSALLSPEIPLVLDPWTMDTYGWSDKYIKTVNTKGIQWEIKSAISVQLQSTNEMNIYPFNGSKAQMAFSEDPNFDYGLGHYLPFPMALVEIKPNQDGYSVDIVINPSN